MKIKYHKYKMTEDGQEFAIPPNQVFVGHTIEADENRFVLIIHTIERDDTVMLNPIEKKYVQ